MNVRKKSLGQGFTHVTVVKVLNSRVANPYHTFKLMLRVPALDLERKEEIIKTGTYRYIFALFIKKTLYCMV